MMMEDIIFNFTVGAGVTREIGVQLQLSQEARSVIVTSPSSLSQIYLTWLLDNMGGGKNQVYYSR